MKLIPLTKGRVAKVDDADYERLSPHKWFLLACDEDHEYAVTWIGTSAKNRQLMRMHRFLLGLGGGRIPMVDHHDRDGLNNQRANLRICRQWQNQGNSRKPKRPSTSKYKGVFWEKRKNCWKAVIRRGQKLKHLGSFASQAAAAHAYDAAATKEFGEFARLNF